MTSKYSIEHAFKVWHDREGVFIEVCDDADGLGNVRIHTTNKLGAEWFGQIDFNLEPEYALQLAEAITLAAKVRIAQEKIS